MSPFEFAGAMPVYEVSVRTTLAIARIARAT